MKLIKHTYSLAALWLIPIAIIGSIFAFYTIRYVFYEETDEYLTYEMIRLIKYHQEHNELPEFHKATDIILDKRYEEPFFKDTLILEPSDNEMIPHRELLFTIEHNNRPMTIVLRHLLPGVDDVWEGTILISIGIIGLVILILLLMVNQVSKTIWQPFYKTLGAITNYKITQPVPKFSETNTDEFNSLNETLSTLLNKISDDYHRTKQFNENASHELQTHLAIIRANAEKLINQADMNATNVEQLQTIFNATVKLSQVQKSLMLLSKIGNLEFTNLINIDLANLVNQAIQLFDEAIDIRHIEIRKNIATCNLVIDEGLGQILVNNLVKNSVKHNVDNGFISIELTPAHLVISNSGTPYDGDPSNLMERFVTGENGNMGIGLAITKQICDLYHYSIKYTIGANSVHSISIDFQS